MNWLMAVKKYNKLYLIGGIILFAAVAAVMAQSELSSVTEENKETKVSTHSVTGTPADNYPDKERPSHCGTQDSTSSSYVKEFEIPTICTQPVGIVVDPEGLVWFTETNTGNVGMFDPKTEEIIEYENELWSMGGSMMWGIAYTDDNEIWFTDEKYDRLWKFSIDKKQYSAYTFTGNHTMKFPQLIVENDGTFLINDFTGNKISILDHDELDSGLALPAQVKTPEGFFTGPPAIGKDGEMWFIAWKYQGTVSLIKYDHTNDKATMFDLTGVVLAPNGLSIDDAESLWISDTASSNIVKFNPDSKQIIKYVTSFPRESTFGNSSGLIKTPITRPYWNSIYDEKLIFNEQQANMIGILDTKTEKLVEYLIPSKNPNWADCEGKTDCGISQVFGFAKADDQIWFTAWVENNIGVIDTSIPLPLEIEFDSKELSIKQGDMSSVMLTIIPSENFVGPIDIQSTTGESDKIHISIHNGQSEDNFTNIPIEIFVSEVTKPGVYKVLISVIQPDVTLSEFITVHVM
ncbi:MAG: lyase [Crenarchaeota archaeon]|nr:MAG: lyase [Thermoproteota archaeon]